MKPKLRFKGFDEEWEKVSLGTIASFSKGKGYSKSDIKAEGTPIILYGQLYTNYKTEISETYSYADIFEGAVISKGGEVVIPASGETAEDIAIASSIKHPGIIIGGDLNVLSFDKSEFDSYFAALSISNSPTHLELSGYAQGKTIVHLHGGEIRKANLSYPLKEEQSAIGAYFHELDEQITATEAKIEELRKVKAACLQAMFPQDGETKPRLRFNGFDDDWEMRSIGGMGFFYSGISGKQKDDFGIGNAQYITFLNVLSNAHIDISLLENVNINANEGQNQVRKGDLFFNTSSETPEEVGMCSVLMENVQNVYLNSFCFGFRPTTTELSPQFFAYLMRSNIGRSIMRVLAQGATRFNLSKSNLASSKIIMPSTKAEQQKIADYFANLDLQISLEERHLEKLRQIKAACLDNMFV